MKELVGPYRIQSLLGHGGMGIVYLGIHDHLGREVAIKALAPELTQHPQFRERFFAEARLQAKLQHTNIVTIYDLIEDAESYFIVMEYVPGPTLETLLKDGVAKGWEVDHTLALFRQILEGLDYAHSKGVIHRDVKSSNVLVADGDQVKLTDFGIALLIGDKRLTASQSTIGTPTYMSPEQILRPRSVDHRSDVYSAAIVLYEMLAGQPPFDADTEYEIKKLQIEAPVPDVRNVNPRVPAAVAEAMATALRKDPDERFQSAGAFLRALHARPVLMPAPAPPVSIVTAAEAAASPPAGILPESRRLALAGSLVLAAGLSLWLLFRPGEEKPQPAPQASLVEATPARAALVSESPSAEPAVLPSAEFLSAQLGPPAEAPATPPLARPRMETTPPMPQTPAAEKVEERERTEPTPSPTPQETPAIAEPVATPTSAPIEPTRVEIPTRRPAARRLSVTGVEVFPQMVFPGGLVHVMAHAKVNPPFERPMTLNIRVRVKRSLDEIRDPISQTVTIPARVDTWKSSVHVKIPSQVPAGDCYIDFEVWDEEQQMRASGRIGFTIK